MKYILLFLMVLASTSVSGQDSEYQQAADARLINVNKSLIPTGILYDRVFPVSMLDRFNQGQSDTSNYNHFWQSYYEIYQSSYNRVGLTTPDDLDNTIQVRNIEGTIPIGFLHYNFNWIDTLANEKSQFSVNNGLVYDVPGRTSSPYLPKQALVLALLTTRTLEPGTYTFKWSSETTLGNTGLQITNFTPLLVL